MLFVKLLESSNFICLEQCPRNGGRSHVVFSQVVGIPLLVDFFVAHGSEGVTALSAYSADYVETFLDESYLFGAFPTGGDEGFSED